MLLLWASVNCREAETLPFEQDYTRQCLKEFVDFIVAILVGMDVLDKVTDVVICNASVHMRAECLPRLPEFIQ